jgi:g-D-glutamyl-meso-diaminopimelate peptidase
MKNIFALSEKYPFLDKKSIGKSVCGRDIPLLTIGEGNEGVLLLAGVHGNESITSTVLLRFCEELCAALADPYHFGIEELTAIAKIRKIYFVPCLNPDGCEI